MWYIQDSDEPGFPTKEEAIARAWELTPPGQRRPGVMLHSEISATTPLQVQYGPPAHVGLTIQGVLTSRADLPAKAAPGDGWLVDGILWVWVADDWVETGVYSGSSAPTTELSTTREYNIAFEWPLEKDVRNELFEDLVRKASALGCHFFDDQVIYQNIFRGDTLETTATVTASRVR